jgi:hypothetical protein
LLGEIFMGKPKLSEEKAKEKSLEVGFELLEPYRGSGEKYRFRCHCGNIFTGRYDKIISGRTKSCGCIALSRVSNHVIPKDLTIIKLAEEPLKTKSVFRCKCGNIIEEYFNDVFSQRIINCGCEERVNHLSSNPGRKKYGQKEAEELIASVGFKLLSPYTGSHDKHLFRCFCGTEFESLFFTVSNKGTKSCGCLRRKTNYEEMFAKNNLEVIENLGDGRFRLKCHCGNIFDCVGSVLNTKKHKDCGCTERRICEENEIRNKKILEQKNESKKRYKMMEFKWKINRKKNEILEMAEKMRRRINFRIIKKKIVREAAKKFALLGFELIDGYENNESMCRLRCECGNIFTAHAHTVLRGHKTSCGCKSPILTEEVVVNRLKLVGFTLLEPYRRGAKEKHLLLCHCGNKFKTTLASVFGGSTRSCGCINSLGNTSICRILQEKNIKYEAEKRFDGLLGVGGGSLRFDFYLPDIGICIEYNGEQHYRNIIRFGGEEELIQRTEHEKRKVKFCKHERIPIFRIPFTFKNNLEKIIMGLIDKNLKTINECRIEHERLMSS